MINVTCVLLELIGVCDNAFRLQNFDDVLMRSFTDLVCGCLFFVLFV